MTAESPTLHALGDDDIDRALAHYREHGWARLGQLAPPGVVSDLGARVDAMMLGELTYPGLFFQHDATTGRYDDLEYGKGWRGPSLEYRKIEKLELDRAFWAWITSPAFGRVASRWYEGQRVTLYRAFAMCKGASGGSELPWHQDGGQFWGLDRDPTLQIWTALDDAPEGGGCVEVVDGSHARGLVTPLGGVVPAEHAAAADAEHRALPLPARAGEVLLIHNHVWHRSGRTPVGTRRRALSVCYMDWRTVCRRKKRAPRVFAELFDAAGSPANFPADARGVSLSG